MLEKGEEKGVFAWAPSLRHWLKDSDYVFWLGTSLFLERKAYQKNNSKK